MYSGPHPQVAVAAFRSKAVIRLLLLYGMCLLILPWFPDKILCVLTNFCKCPAEEERAGCLTLSVFLIASVIRPRGYKTFFTLNSTEHGISIAHKILNAEK